MNVFPNPITSHTVRIDYTLENKEQITCQVYDAAGRRIRTLVIGEQNAGKHSITWDRKDANGLSVNAGIYFIKLDTQTGYAQEKLIIVN